MKTGLGLVLDMIRLKRKQKRILYWTVFVYILSLFVFEVLYEDEDELEFDSTSLVRLSDDVFVLSAFWETRTAEKFVRVITISAVKTDTLFKTQQRDVLSKLYKDDSFAVQCDIVCDNGDVVPARINATIFEETLGKDESIYLIYFSCQKQNKYFLQTCPGKSRRL